jgi:hypothetical protein
MRRIDSPNRAVDLFGAGKDGFKAAIAGVTPATELTPDWFNSVQEAIVRTIEEAGILLSETDYDQFTNAVLKLIDDGVAGKENAFPSGTRLLFQQSTAPVGWTKVTDHDNKALRVVSGAAGSGGTVDFTTAFVNGSVGAHALTIAEMPAHSHTFTNEDGGDSVGGIGYLIASSSQTGVGTVTPTAAISNTGGDGAHSHTLNLDVKYVDVIIASKN